MVMFCLYNAVRWTGQVAPEVLFSGYVRQAALRLLSGKEVCTVGYWQLSNLNHGRPPPFPPGQFGRLRLRFSLLFIGHHEVAFSAAPTTGHLQSGRSHRYLGYLSKMPEGQENHRTGPTPYRQLCWSSMANRNGYVTGLHSAACRLIQCQ